MLVAPGSLWLLSGLPQGHVPKSYPLSGWPGRGGHTAQEPRYTARWPQVLAVENRLTPPSSGFLEIRLPLVF